MNATLNRKDLAAAIKWIDSNIKLSPDMPITGAIKIRVQDDRVILEGVSFEASLTASIPATISTAGEATVPVSALSSFLAQAKDDTVVLSRSQNILTIFAGKAKIGMQCFADAFPSLPTLNAGQEVLTIDSSTLRTAITDAMRCTSTVGDDWQAGIQLSGDSGQLVVIGAHKYAMLRQVMKVDNVDHINISVPGKSLAALIGDFNGDITLHVDGGLLWLTDKVKSASLRLYGDTHVHPEGVQRLLTVPDSPATTTTVDRDELLSALGLVASISDAAYIDATGTKMTVASAPDVDGKESNADVSDEIDCDGDDWHARLNIGYMQGVLRGMTSGEVQILTGDGKSVHVVQGDVVGLFMPLRDN